MSVSFWKELNKQGYMKFDKIGEGTFSKVFKVFKKDDVEMKNPIAMKKFKNQKMNL